MKFRYILIFFTIYLCSGCFEGRKFDIEKLRGYEEPGPVFSKDVKVRKVKKYTIGKKDVITVTVKRHSEFSGDFKVGNDGTITIRHLDKKVDAVGMYEDELAVVVAEKLSPYTKLYPEVKVKIKNPLSRFYYVFGAAGKKGKFYMGLNEVRILDAVIDAGFLSGSASNDIHIITPDREEPTYAVVNMREIFLGKMKNNVKIKPGDIIYVPLSWYSEFNAIWGTVIGEINRGIAADAMYRYLERRFHGQKPGVYYYGK